MKPNFGKNNTFFFRFESNFQKFLFCFWSFADNSNWLKPKRLSLKLSLIVFFRICSCFNMAATVWILIVWWLFKLWIWNLHNYLLTLSFRKTVSKRRPSEHFKTIKKLKVTWKYVNTHLKNLITNLQFFLIFLQNYEISNLGKTFQGALRQKKIQLSAKIETLVLFWFFLVTIITGIFQSKV